MSLEDATFVVQRGDEQLSCLGKDLSDKVVDNLMLCQDGEVHKSIQLFTKLKIWENWAYNADSSELPLSHPAKNPGNIDKTWIDVKRMHSGDSGSVFAAVSALKPGDKVYINGELTVVEDTYSWSSDTRFSIKVGFETPMPDSGQTVVYIDFLALQDVPDDILFIVTDGDNGHKSVTGAQVKDLLKPELPDLPDSPDGAGEINTLGVVWTPGTKEMTCVKTDGGAGLDPSHANFFKVEINHPELDLNDYYFSLCECLPEGRDGDGIAEIGGRTDKSSYIGPNIKGSFHNPEDDGRKLTTEAGLRLYQDDPNFENPQCWQWVTYEQLQAGGNWRWEIGGRASRDKNKLDHATIQPYMIAIPKNLCWYGEVKTNGLIPDEPFPDKPEGYLKQYFAYDLLRHKIVKDGKWEDMKFGWFKTPKWNSEKHKALLERYTELVDITNWAFVEMD